MSENYPRSSRNIDPDWDADFGPRRFKHDKSKRARDDDMKPHNRSGKAHRGYRHDFEQDDTTMQPDDSQSFFAGDETLAEEIANPDGRSGEIIGDSNFAADSAGNENEGIIASEGVTSKSETGLQSDRSVTNAKNAARRANAARIAEENRANSATTATSSRPTESPIGDVDGQSLAGKYESSGDEDESNEKTVVFFPPHNSQSSQSETVSSNEPDVAGGVSVDDLEPQTVSKSKPKKSKGKKAKRSQEPEPTLAEVYEEAKYADDQFFGPEEHPLRKFVRTSESYNDARIAYDTADKELAGKVARRLKLGMFASKKTREASSTDVETAHSEYERMAEAFDAIQIEKWKIKNPSISDEEIDHKLAKFHEAKLRLQGLRGQHEIVTGGKFGKLSELNNKATEWYAGLSKKQKIGFAVGGLAVGAVAGGLVATAGTILGATAGVVGGGLLAGAKVYKTTMQGRAGLHRNTVEVDKTDFINTDGSYKSIDELRVQSSDSFKKGFDQRVEKADKINKKAKWMTIASAALLGAGIAGHIDAVHDAYKAAEGGIADYFGMTDHHDVLPSGGHQGGGSGSNPVDKMGSGDVNPHNQYSFGHHDGAPAPTPTTPVELVPRDMGGATEFSGAGLEHFNQWANGHTVQPGESVWKLSQNYLQANGVRNPSVYQIDAVKDKVLAEFSAKGLVDSRGWLTAGARLSIR